jgi:hypothetical protein
MFWSERKDQRQQLREELRLRLRVAADFATLGAYELSEADEAPAEPVREDPPKRVFLFAKVAPVCSHSTPVERECGEKRPARGRTRGRQRAGAVRTPEQPCQCVAERVPSA